MADDFGKTVVVVLHDVNVAAHHSDRIVAMKQGRIVADGARAQILVPEVLADVFDLDVPVAHVDGLPVAMHFAARLPHLDPGRPAMTTTPHAQDAPRLELVRRELRILRRAGSHRRRDGAAGDGVTGFAGRPTACR